jgi:hypothetical protein
MLKTLDVVIGTITVLLLFSMGVTVITHGISTVLQYRGKHLLDGLTSLLSQLGISKEIWAKQIAQAMLKHPLIAETGGRFGTVLHREEFIKLLLDLASGNGTGVLAEDARAALLSPLQIGGIPDPKAALNNIWAMAAQIEATNPELANHVRDGLAIAHEASGSFVVRTNFWFDSTIDRVNHRFTNSVRWVTISVALLMITLSVQLDVVAVMNRLTADDQARSIATQAGNQVVANGQEINPQLEYNVLNNTGLMTIPDASNWVARIKDARRWPGMALSVLLLSLGAPFWYNILKDMLGLRSQLARNDSAQRKQRQNGQIDPDGNTLASPDWIRGERGNLAAV